MVLDIKNPTANTGDVRDVGSIPGLGRCPGGGDGNPLQYPCLGNPTGRAAWQVADKDKTERAHAGNFTFVYHFVISKFYISMNLICMIKMMEGIPTVLN